MMQAGRGQTGLRDGKAFAQPAKEVLFRHPNLVEFDFRCRAVRFRIAEKGIGAADRDAGCFTGNKDDAVASVLGRVRVAEA